MREARKWLTFELLRVVRDVPFESNPSVDSIVGKTLDKTAWEQYGNL